MFSAVHNNNITSNSKTACEMTKHGALCLSIKASWLHTIHPFLNKVQTRWHPGTECIFIYLCNSTTPEWKQFVKDDFILFHCALKWFHCVHCQNLKCRLHFLKVKTNKDFMPSDCSEGQAQLCNYRDCACVRSKTHYLTSLNTYSHK